MKKIFLFGVLSCLALGTQAKVLRVSNVTGSNAPYTTYEDAEAAAAEGDTIVLEGSNVLYPAMNISKKLVVMGSGYYLVENGISQVNGQVATVDGVSISAAEAKLQSLKVKGVTITADRAIVNRCYVYDEPIKISASHVVIHQNLILAGYYRSVVEGGEYVQITNNIWDSNNSNGKTFIDVKNSYIAYNTNTSATIVTASYQGVENCTFERNLFGQKVEGDNCIHRDYYYYYGNSLGIFGYWKTDADIEAVCGAEENADYVGYGAFAGTDPYVISGVPAGPVIEDVTMPVSVEQGKPLEVTVKVKIQQ